MSITATEFDFVRNLLIKSAAIVLDKGKEYLVETRLTPIARRTGLASVNELIARLQSQSNSQLHTSVIEALTTNETSFFRDIHPFDALKKTIIPEILAKRSTEKKLSIWCGACSTGQEPYSIAMLLMENFPQLQTWKVDILCTDINQTVMLQAKEGRYNQLEVNRGLPASYLIKFFTQVQLDWVINENLRKLLNFRQMNLAVEWPLIPQADIVFLRNVMIYFDVEVKKAILKRMRQVLRPDGYLFLGSAETTMNLDDNFKRVPIEKTICYRIAEGETLTSSPGVSTASQPFLKNLAQPGTLATSPNLSTRINSGTHQTPSGHAFLKTALS